MTMHLSLRQLKLFEAVARHLSFTRAAEEMHLTQPAVSIQIKQLESNIGFPLFEQIGKRIFLTDVGQELYDLSGEMLELLARFEMSVADRKGLKQGRLRLAVTTTAKYFVPRLLGPFCQRHPGIDVSLKVSNRERMLERLAGNQDDLYIFGQPPKHLAVRSRPFLENRLVPLTSPDHPLAGKSRIPLQRLVEEPFLMRELGSGTRMATEQFFRDQGVSVQVRMELGSNEAIKQAVMGRLGLAVLSHNAVMLESAMGQLAILDVEGFPLPCHWYLVYPAEKKLSVVAQAFYDYLEQIAPVGAPRMAL
jgi:DNA-binding transcriptional LysR family regulator